MSTLNYIDENGNINKVGVIPQNYIQKVNELANPEYIELLSTNNTTEGTAQTVSDISEFSHLIIDLFRYNNIVDTLIVPVAMLKKQISGIYPKYCLSGSNGELNLTDWGVVRYITDTSLNAFVGNSTSSSIRITGVKH